MPPQRSRLHRRAFAPSSITTIQMQCLFLLLALFTTLLVNTCGQRIDADSDAHITPKLLSKAPSSLPQVGDFFPALNEFSSHTVIRPEIYHGHQHKRVIGSTLNAKDGFHLPHIALTYFHQGQRVYIDLKRNDKLLPAEHFLRYQNSKAPLGHVVENFTKTEIELCHYQGTIRGKPTSSVAISTCNGGVNGIFFDGIDTYFIHSGSDGRLQDEHYLFRHSDVLNKNTTCGYHDQGATNDEHKIHEHEEVRNNLDGDEFNRILRYKRSYDESNVIRGPYNANKYSSYVELVIVVDNKVYKSFGENMKKVHQHCKDLANIINALYVPLNIFVALVGVVIWNENNEIEFSSDGDVTLRNFLNYRRTKLVLEHPNDNAQLLTKEQFNGGVVGKALKGPICTHEYSGGVSMEHSPVTAVVATTMAHEMGHNFGMEHDSPDCKCQDEKCIMSASSTAVVPVHWSSCSIDQLNIAFSRGMNYCLRNKPTKLFDSPQCGNGFVEPGEQCDCGLPSYCENTCCDPYTCMLHTNASCATGECCDLSTCRPKNAGTTCRTAENECDLPEYCTGESEYCPMDVFKRDTEDCDNGQAYCFQGNCRSHHNQCRILWGPTGESSEHCYWKNTEGKRGGNCGYNRLNNTFIPCEQENVGCGMLHCRHLNERLEFGMESAAVLSHSFINHGGSIVPCRTALVDLGLQSTDPGLTPSGAKCGDNKMCVDQKCLTIAQVREDGLGKPCPDNCNGNGICNSQGNCHCDIGYTGRTCLAPGPGGSIDSGPATNPNSHDAFQRFMYIFFFAVIPFMAILCFLMYYWRNHPFFLRGKLAENIIKSASGKQPPNRGHPHHGNAHHQQTNGSLPKSTPSSTDDMNSALLKSPSDSQNDNNVGNSMFGKFKGFTLRPLNDTPITANNLNAPNVAYVQPTIQQDNNSTHMGVPQRAAPPPPLKVSEAVQKFNGTLGRKAPAPPVNHSKTATAPTAPALPPPNPGSQARPIISMPVLETSTLNLQLKSGGGGGINSPIRTAPSPPPSVHSNNNMGTLKPTPATAPMPPVPLHTDPKLNIKRDGTIRRIASFLKKEEKPPIKEKTYIDREKLRNLEISAPMPVAPQGESSNSDSEATSPKEDETKNLVKRAQSMRSPTKKTNVQSFGSMRQAPGSARPKSAVGGNATTRPKSPPPRPPPLLKKTNSTTSSGYQLPVATAKTSVENAYDDCEFVEVALTSVGEAADETLNSDNIYSVIDEIPPAAQTLKRSDLVSNAIANRNSTTSDLGLLGEIVNEIEKRNGDSIYTSSIGSSSTKGKEKEIEKTQQASAKSIITTTKTPTTAITPTPAITTSNEATSKAATTAITTAAPAAATYLRPAPVNTPVARVAPTRSDLSPTTAFSSFKPPPASTASSTKPTTTSTQQRFGGNSATNNIPTTTTTVQRNKSFGKPSTAATNKSLPNQTNNIAGINSTPSATIQKPKLLSAKPSFSNNQKKPQIAAGGPIAAAAHSTNQKLGNATSAPKVPTLPSKSGNIASLTQKFEKNGSNGGAGAGARGIAVRK